MERNRKSHHHLDLNVTKQELLDAAEVLKQWKTQNQTWLGIDVNMRSVLEYKTGKRMRETKVHCWKQEFEGKERFRKDEDLKKLKSQL